MAPLLPRAPGRTTARAALAGLLVVLGGAACDAADRLLRVTTPSRLGESGYLVPQNASLIVASAVADFECAFGAYVVVTGLTAGELADGSQTAARWSYDRRDVNQSDVTYAGSSCEGLGIYTPLSTARFTADQALRQLDGWTDQQVPNRARLIDRAALYAGWSLLLLGESFCSAAVGGGPELQTPQLLDSAAARFTRVIGAAATGADAAVLNAAYLGRARARLGRGDLAGAAADAERVPQAFVFAATADASSGRRQNRLFQQNNQARLVSVAPAYRTLGDPRVPVVNTDSLMADQITRFSRQTKFGSLTTSLTIGSGVEARLILAEARGAGEGVGIVNALRARAGVALPALTAAQTADFAGTVREERRRELFLHGTRLFDLRRANVAPTPAPGTAYPKGGSYGTQLCYPLPDLERAANPNIRTGG
jgi:hypothetical protein